ncbi:MAG: ankyrin repeat domain-containing protein [Vulcanimicrobiota bacterium]
MNTEKARRFLKAVESNEILSVEAMLKQDPELIRSKDEYDGTPLCYAASKDMVELLIEHGDCINARNSNNATPMHYATNNNHSIDVIELLISRGADVNALSDSSTSPLHIAVDLGNLEAVKLLVSNGADLNNKDKDGFSPILVALDELPPDEGIPMARFLVSLGAHVQDIQMAAHMGDIKMVKSMLDENPELVNHKDHSGNTALHYAIWYRHLDVADLLINNQADINAIDNRKMTVLHYAASAGDDEAVEFLIKRGANTDAEDGNHQSAL